MIVTNIRRPSIILGLLIISIFVYGLVERVMMVIHHDPFDSPSIVSPTLGRHISSTPPLLGTRSAFDDVSTTSDWKTYSDLRFSIQYPGGWFVDGSPSGCLIFTSLAHSPEELEEVLPAIWLFVVNTKEYGPDWQDYIHDVPPYYIHDVPPYATYLRKTEDKIYVLVAVPYWGKGTDNGRRVSKKVLDRMVNTLTTY